MFNKGQFNALSMPMSGKVGLYVGPELLLRLRKEDVPEAVMTLLGTLDSEQLEEIVDEIGRRYA